MCLKETRHDRPCLIAVLVVSLAEGVHEVRFFHPRLAQIGDDANQQSEERVELPRYDRGTRVHHQQRSVDGVTYDGIRSGAHQLVVFLDGDFTAPVASQRATRPDGEHESGALENESDQPDNHHVGKKSMAQRANGRDDLQVGD